MEFKSIKRKINRTPEDLARIKSIREKFQRERPTVDQILESGEYKEALPLGVYLETKKLLHDLKKQREEAGMSLADVAERSGMDKAAVSRLENGHQQNPTVDTLSRYAAAIGKLLVLGYTDLPSREPGTQRDRKNRTGTGTRGQGPGAREEPDHTKE
jgi:transcriptional regulator with XRE-family HTH domain